MLKLSRLAFSALAAIVFLGTASSAHACPPQNENLLIPEYNGQENVFLASIDALTSTLRQESHRLDFMIARVSLNGEIVCAGYDCKRVVSIKSGALLNSDYVEVIFVARQTAAEPGRTLVYNRIGPVRDQGSKCKPLWPAN